MALDGNTKAQEKALQQKCQHMIQTFAQAPLATYEVKLGYQTVILPTLKYGLAATAIPWYTIDKIQKPLTYSILPKMGYNRRFPRAIVHAPEQIGGLGLQLISAEQGIAHIQHIIGSLRANNDNYNTILILLESFVITSGITGNPLVNMMPTDYIEARWLETARIFLNAVNATITIPSLTTIEPQSHRDRSLMLIARDTTTNTNELRLINNCRLYLQIHLLTEILTPDGTAILTDAFHGHPDTNGQPRLWKVSKSTLKWPLQPRPPDKAWQMWRKMLRPLMRPKENMQLRRKLGPATTNSPRHRLWFDRPQPHTPPNLPPNTQPHKWTSRTFHKLCDTNTIDLLIHTTAVYEHTGFSWTVAVNGDSIMHDAARCPPTLFTAKMRRTLLGLLHATIAISAEYYARHAPMQKCILRIWTECTRTIRKLDKYHTTFHTPSSANKAEDDLHRQVITALNIFPHTTLHRLHKNTPSAIKDIFTYTRLTPHQLLQLPTIYNPPAGTATLCINSEIVTCDVAQHLRNAYSTQQYRAYLAAKFNWNDSTMDDIDWPIFSRAFNKLKGNQKKIIQKLIHKWLPLNAHPSQEKTGTARLCPICTREDETHDHFLYCTADKAQWNEDLCKAISRSTMKPPVTLITLLQTALVAQTHSTTGADAANPAVPGPLRPPDRAGVSGHAGVPEPHRRRRPQRRGARTAGARRRARGRRARVGSRRTSSRMRSPPPRGRSPSGAATVSTGCRSCWTKSITAPAPPAPTSWTRKPASGA